ncbi:protein kinase family protein [Oceanobacillus salinisoli]|uniref:hypothetical protein n=1 Tax=Oceanobacillus salinisoli TaxID=2678611 RepID=UPI0012E19946|nr:hypothetical protein [Oceanobacillus salinisoli]
MPFSGFLSTYYGIQVEEKIGFGREEGYRNGNNFYFITSIENREMVYLEQASLAYYLKENQVDHISLPIPNLQGEWFTPYHDKNYMVMQVNNMQQDNRISHGLGMAEFHQVGAQYQYQPKEISSYGDWRSLWIDKLTYFEAKIEEEAKNNPCDYYQLLMDVLPYLIGISENAIQYIRESETESRFHKADQGTITFNRYSNQLKSSVLWPTEFVYDHPARDIAEYIRTCFLYHERQEEIVHFVDDYQSVSPLSIFSLRLIYGRLLFPIHLFDVIYRGFMAEDLDQLYLDLRERIDQQSDYEKKLRGFYEKLDIDSKSLDIPVLHWL